MLKCRDIAEQASDYIEGRQSFRQRLAVAFHLLICGNCREFIRHLRLALTFYSRVPTQQTSDEEAERLVQQVLDKTKS
jgi:hypothetical protein